MLARGLLGHQWHAASRAASLELHVWRHRCCRAAAASALRRALSDAARCLELLASGIQGRVTDSRTARLVTVACRLFGLCADACSWAHELDPPPRFPSSVQFLLSSSVAVQQHLLEARSEGLASDNDIASILGVQATALDSWLLLVTQLQSPGSLSALAEECAPPALLHTWLCQTVHSVRTLEPPSWEPGGL